MRRLLIVAALTFIAAPVFAQSSILTIQELDEDGNQIALTDKSRIVDINSTLNLTIDRNALNQYLQQKGLTGDTGDLVTRISALTDALKREEVSLQKLQQAFATDPGPNASLSERKAHWEQTAAAAADSALLVNTVPQIRDYLQPLLVQDPSAANPIEQYRLVYVAAANMARDLQAQVDSAATTNGVYVQLGAWTETTPIHIEGFDEYPTGQQYVVPRWTLTLSSEEQARLTAYANLATKVNSDGVKALLSWKNIGPAIIEAYLQDTQSGKCAAGVASDFDAAKSQAWANVGDIKAKLEQGRKDAQDYVDFLEGLKKAYATGGSATTLAPAAFLIQSNKDIQDVVTRTAALPNVLKADADAVVKAVGTTVAAATTAAQQLATKAQSCVGDAKTDVDNLKTNVQKELKALQGQADFNTAALELGDQVKKLSLNQVPSTASIPLVTTGKRDPGDHITIKFAVGTANTQREVLETRQLIMYRILWHMDLKANLIWADPGEKTAVTHFQAAPAYNAMLKHGSRKSVLWNSLLDPGIGLNLAALDFNHDDAQEMGISIAVSAIRDFLTVGYGYNVSQGVKYWFFGLRLPVPGATINGTRSGAAPAQ